MQWQHHEAVVARGPDEKDRTGARAVLDRITRSEPVDRLVLEGYLGSQRVPAVPDDEADRTSYAKAWIFGHPLLVMTVRSADGQDAERADVWFSSDAHAAWKVYVDRCEMLPPRKRAKVYETGDESSPYVILGARVRRWNASQDLPKQLVGATAEDPDGNVFLGRLPVRWRPIAQALVAETVKDARRPVPETTRDRRYAVASLGDGQMIRYGKDGPVWVDADAAVHLADLAGYPLGYPDEISHPIGGEGWTRLADILAEAGADGEAASRIADQTTRTDDVGYAVFAGEVGTGALKAAFPEYRWGRGGPSGERMKDDVDARYWRMLFRGHPAIGVETRGRREVWLSSSAQARLIDDLAAQRRTPEEVPPPSPAVGAKSDPTEAHGVESAPTPPPRLRKRQRKAVSRAARALSRLRDAGLSLVLHEGVLKARIHDGDENEKGMIAIFPESPVVPIVD
jgi:hypothetical protein